MAMMFHDFPTSRNPSWMAIILYPRLLFGYLVIVGIRLLSVVIYLYVKWPAPGHGMLQGGRPPFGIDQTKVSDFLVIFS